MRRRFVVARTRPKHAALLAALRRNACASNRSHAQLISLHVAAPPLTAPPSGAVAGSHVVLRPRRGTAGGHVLGELTAPLGVSPSWLKPILLAVVGVALALLVLAVLPQRTAYPSGPALVLARHRAGFLVAGLALLAGVMLVVLL